MTASIDGELTIYRAAELRATLQAALQAAQTTGSDLALNLAGVSEMDSAGVQLLLAAQKSLQARSRHLHLDTPSEAVLEVLGFLNLSDHLSIRRNP
jgi:anti-sigma B factor antagonist